jgi:RNA polymerase sigma-70 factor (family 1)
VNPVNLYEAILLEKLKNGDQTAFSTIFTRYYRDLTLFANSILHNTEHSEEIVQDVFVKLWENCDSLQIHSSLKSYLVKSVQNRCIDWIRHMKIRNRYGSEVLDNPVISANDAEEYVLYSELSGKIDTILEHLPEDVANTFKMNRYDGLKYHEIAEKLDVSVRTVEVRISKALQMLREKLGDYMVVLILLAWLLEQRN